MEVASLCWPNSTCMVANYVQTSSKKRRWRRTLEASALYFLQ